jgi:hypothetical protein
LGAEISSLKPTKKSVDILYVDSENRSEPIVLEPEETTFDLCVGLVYKEKLKVKTEFKWRLKSQRKCIYVIDVLWVRKYLTT